MREHTRERALLATLIAELEKAIAAEYSTYRFADQDTKLEVTATVSATEDSITVEGELSSMKCLLSILERMR